MSESMMNFFIFIMISFNSMFCVPCRYNYRKKKNIILINTVESNNSFISYIIFNGNKYIFKQKKYSSKQFSVVRDALAAYIAHDLAIAHSVEIVASKTLFTVIKRIVCPGVV